jgi:hypothetical protein
MINVDIGGNDRMPTEESRAKAKTGPAHDKHVGIDECGPNIFKG